MLSRLRRLLDRLRDARLAQVAGSLSFTTLLSLVPLLAVGFALFKHLPGLRPFQRSLEELWLAHLLPPEIATAVLRHLGRFADNAHTLSWTAYGLLVITAVALMLTVENALNQIWQVRRGRPWLKRLALYLPLVAAGPLVLGMSLWAVSHAVAVSKGWLSDLPVRVEFMWALGPALLSFLTLTLLFYMGPHTTVRPRHALLGGLIGAAGLEFGKQAFAAFVLKLPTYRALYGGFAVLPVFLLWVYYSWIVTLAAALLTAQLGTPPAKRQGRQSRLRAAPKQL